MNSWLAIGPRARVWAVPSSVVTAAGPSRVCGTPCHTRKIAPTRQIGRRMYITPRARSTQKLPSVWEVRRVRPRTRAMATARPVAAEVKLRTASIVIWLK